MVEKPQTKPSSLKKKELLSKLTYKDNILIVDDDPLILTVLENTLLRDGYKVLTAKTGKEALEHVRCEPIAVIICDINLPDMNGIEVCKKIKETHGEIERLLITAMTNLKDLEADFAREEITHVISKPWEDLVLRQTVRMAWRKHQVSKEHALLKEWIESAQDPLPSLTDYIPKHLRFAKRVQEQILVAKNDPTLSGLDIETHFLPLDNTCMDFYDFYYPGQDHFDVVLGNVQEKGVAAALVGTLIKSEIANFQQPIKKNEIYEKREGWQENVISLEGLFEILENKIGEKLYALDILTNLTIARFNLSSRKLKLINCGNPRGILYQSSSKKVVHLQAQKYPPLGLQKHEQWVSFEINYEPEDLFIFYSAGFSSQAEDYLLDLLKEKGNLESQPIIEKIKELLNKLELESDVTFIVLKMNRKESLYANRFLSATFKSSIEELEHVRNFTQQLCRNVPGDKEKLDFHLQLVINEIFCNIVEHGYNEDPKGLIIIKGIRENDGISLDFFDQGSSYTPSHVPEPILTGEMVRGFGLFIVKELVTRFVYTSKTSENEWNHLHIFKKFCVGEGYMNINHTLANDVLIITPEVTNLDAKFASEFKEKVIQLITENETNHVVLDLNQVQFIDSSGLGSFLSVLRLLHAQGGELKLARVHRPIKTMFELVAMNKIFDIHDQTEDAIAAFNNE